MKVILAVMKDDTHEDFRIKWPTEFEMAESAARLQKYRQYGYALRGVFGVTDGARLDCVSFVDNDLQNAYFQKFTQEVEVTNLLVWNFKGEIIHAALNFPGSWHDSKLAYVSGLYWPSLAEDSITPPEYAILGDSAFVHNTRVTNGKVLRAKKANEMGCIPLSDECAAVELLLQRLYPKDRESAEWGIRGLRGPFRRLTTTMPSDGYKRGMLLSVVCHLSNYRTRNIGCNQIRSVYC